jgi:uncharacterized protein
MIAKLVELLRPHLRVQKVFDLDAAVFHRYGLNAALLDIDNTLAPCYAKDYRQAELWVEQICAAGFHVALLSNAHTHRVARIAGLLKVPFRARALKPMPFGCKDIVRSLGLDSNRTCLVGDQVFADVLAGRLAGLFTILVNPIGDDEPWFTRIKRPFERGLLARMNPVYTSEIHRNPSIDSKE